MMCIAVGYKRQDFPLKYMLPGRVCLLTSKALESDIVRQMKCPMNMRVRRSVQCRRLLARLK